MKIAYSATDPMLENLRSAVSTSTSHYTNSSQLGPLRITASQAAMYCGSNYLLVKVVDMKHPAGPPGSDPRVDNNLHVVSIELQCLEGSYKQNQLLLG